MIKALRPHLVPFLSLLGFLTLTALGAWLPLGGFNLPLALTIGTIKTGLVAWFFMELKKPIISIRLAAIVGVIWLGIFLLLVMTDYFSRFPGYLLDR